VRTLAEGVFTVASFLMPDECDHHIRGAEAEGFEPATIESSGRAVREPNVRNNDRIIRDDEALSRDLWVRLAAHVPAFMDGRQAWGLNERWRIYRYHPGQQFAGHVDAPFRRENGEKSLLTLLLYLNDDFDGGETTFGDLAIRPERGMALLFRHELFHAGQPLRRGTKYVLRSDVMFGPIGTIRG
jgi:predicted 2-oxoglutarate/Fe(II)-dependent dioxygenase YbiX